MIKRYQFIFILSIFCQSLLAQQIIDYGTVKFDSAFSCKYSSDSSIYGANKICNSSNEFEIRLETIALPGAFYRALIIFGFTNGKWIFEKYKVSRGVYGRKIEHTKFGPPIDSVANNYYGHLVFDSLKQNNAFALPNQSDLKIQMTIFDGLVCIVTFKIGNKYGRYSYSNPGSYQKLYPDIIEFKQILSIMKNLGSF